jgi:hypothetical protein
VPFRGNALIAIWNDIAADGRADFIEWHNREHIFERLSIPGFLSGRRYRAVSDLPEYFTLYEVESLRTTTGPDYQARLDNPTAWTKHAIQSYRNLSRSLCEVAYSQGRGLGGYLQTICFEAQAERALQLRQDLVERVLPPLLKMAGVTGLHLGIADRAASSVQSEEKKDHTVEVPSWVLLIESTNPDAARHPGERLLLGELRRAGAGDAIKANLYTIEFACSSEELGRQHAAEHRMS